MNYCSDCGASVSLRIPSGDDRPRFVCDRCGLVHYENPNMVVGCIPRWRDRILLCRRAIEPRYGHWTLPAGYLENQETVQQGAAREALEEAGAVVRDLQPFAILNIASISQVYFMFLAELEDGPWVPGKESLEVRLFESHAIPWRDLAFSSIVKTLELYLEDLGRGPFSFHIADIQA